MYFVRRLRALSIQSSLLDQTSFYKCGWAAEKIRDWQLDRFNEQWQKMRRCVPYFREQALPDSFASWQHLKQAIPFVDKRTLQDNVVAMTDSTRPPDQWRSTGGSTAEPVRIPVWNSERMYATRDMWYARKWFGVDPGDKLFLIWGHSHLLGSGISGRVNGLRRRLTDRALGYHRYSAYDLSEPAMRRAADELLRQRPKYLLSYSVALERFANVNKHRQSEFHQLDLKVAIATAESFTRDDSAQTIAGILGCPVVMEYGAVETGPIAHQRQDGKFSVFWGHYYIEGLESKDVPGTYEILVTSLYPRCIPLVRYKIGDLVSTAEGTAAINQEFDRVIGRCNDFIVLPNDDLVHSEAFSHALKEIPAIMAFQVVQSEGGKVTLAYIARQPLAPLELTDVRRRLVVINPQLESVLIERADFLEQTIAGKVLRVIGNRSNGFQSNASTIEAR